MIMCTYECKKRDTMDIESFGFEKIRLRR